MFSCCDWWPWTKPGNITKIRRQNNDQWCGGIAARPAPNNSECKNPLEMFSSRFDFLGSRWHSPHWLSSQGPNYQHGEFSSLLVQLKEILKEKHQGGLVLARQCRGSQDTCNPHETGLPELPISWSPTLFSGSGPVGLPPLLWTEKQMKSRHFSSDAKVIPAAETWLDGQTYDFLWVACKR